MIDLTTYLLPNDERERGLLISYWGASPQEQADLSLIIADFYEERGETARAGLLRLGRRMLEVAAQTDEKEYKHDDFLLLTPKQTYREGKWWSSAIPNTNIAYQGYHRIGRLLSIALLRDRLSFPEEIGAVYQKWQRWLAFYELYQLNLTVLPPTTCYQDENWPSFGTHQKDDYDGAYAELACRSSRFNGWMLVWDWIVARTEGTWHYVSRFNTPTYYWMANRLAAMKRCLPQESEAWNWSLELAEEYKRRVQNSKRARAVDAGE